MKSSPSDIERFLQRLKGALQAEGFDIDRDFTLIKSSKNDYYHSTEYTIADLDYDTQDVIERIKELTLQEYSETLFDKDDMDPPVLFVFGKDINGKQIYIKIKQRESQANHVVCVSFHYAAYDMPLPYKE